MLYPSSTHTRQQRSRHSTRRTVKLARGPAGVDSEGLEEAVEVEVQVAPAVPEEEKLERLMLSGAQSARAAVDD